MDDERHGVYLDLQRMSGFTRRGRSDPFDQGFEARGGGTLWNGTAAVGDDPIHKRTSASTI